MSTITLPNIRVSSDLTVKLKLKDGGVALDWSTLQNIKVSIYSDAQRALAGRCGASIDAEDPTLLVCTYAANKPQYVGVNRVVVSAKYMGETKTYDKPAFNFVRWTDDQAGEQITIEDPDIDVEISVEDVSSSILQEAVDAAFSAADRANDAAEAAEHMVDIHTGPEGKSAYEVAVEEGYTGTEEEWLASLKGPVGETPDISIGTVTTVEPGTPAAASMSGTPEAPVLNLTIPKGAVGATPNFTVGTVTTGDPGTPVVVTITGTPEAPVLNVTIPQGMQGNTGSSVDYPYELVNNLTTNDPTKGLSAAQGVVLDGKVSQLEAEVNGNPTSNYTDGGYINNSGSVSASDTYAYSEYIPVSAGANLTINYGTIDGNLYVVVYNTNKSKLDFWTLYSNATTKEITTPANTVYLRFSFKPGSAASVYDGDTLVWEKQDASAGLTGKVSALETKTDELDEQDDAFDVELNGRIRYTEGGYINAGGAVVAQEGLCYTDYIPVTAGDSYKFVFGTIPQQLYLVFYDSAKVKVDYYSESPTDTERTVTAYAGSSFVRFSFVPTTNAKIYHSDTEIWEAKTTGINEKIQDLQDEILPSWEAKNLLTPGYYVNALNGLNANADYAYTPYIDVTAGDELTFDFGDNAISLYAVFVNDSLQSVDYFSLSAGMKKRTLTIPENATKVRFSCGKTYNARIWDGEDIYWQAIYDTLPNRVESLETADRAFDERITAIEVQTSHTDVDYEGREIYVFCKGVALGDSLTKGSENYTTPAPASTVVIPKFSYPSKLSQMTGIEIGNISIGGISTADFYDLYKNDDWSGYEFAIIQLGVNDHAAGQTEWPATDKTGMENIITKLKNENEGIFVFVSTILPATAYYGRDYISQGIRDLVEELDDDHVILLDMAVHSHLGDSAGYNNGHLSALGYQELAREYASYISYVISQNKELFRKVQFIGTQYDYQP